MNREQRRSYVKKMQKKGMSKKTAKTYAEMLSFGSGKATPPLEIKEDEQVKLNLENIKARKNYEKMTDKYKEFVNSNADRVFTAHVEKENLLISLKEEPEWLFWSGDLIKVENEEADD